MEITKMRENLKAKLAASGWDRVLSDFIDSDEFYMLMTNLKRADETTGITPDISEVFRVFYECPYKDLYIVTVCQDPYPDEGVADGLAFSDSHSGVVQPSLKVIFEEIQESVYASKGHGDWYSWNPDLTRWAKQGILLLNTAMTTEPGKIGVHCDIWKPFIDYLFTKLANMNSGLIYIFIGNGAKDWAKKTPESNHKFYCYHPSAAYHSGVPWESNDVFVRANEILEGNNGTKIIW